MDANYGKWAIRPTIQENLLNHSESDKDDRPLTCTSRTKIATWQVPPGVSKANWEYVRAAHISTGYDEFLSGDPLTAVDRQILARYLPDVRALEKDTGNLKGPIVADFGCGTGRTLAPLLRRGYRGVGIDLSIPMLQTFEEKQSGIPESGSGCSVGGDLLLLQANLVELDGIADNTIDHGISLFSTLGMIQGAQHRSAFLGHVRRMIKPGGLFIVHAHNAWFQIRHPGGMRWALESAASHVRGKSEFGDRTANYRNIKQMFIHSFRRRELARLLRAAGFVENKWFGVLPGVELPQAQFPMASSIRLVGWIVICE